MLAKITYEKGFSVGIQLIKWRKRTSKAMEMSVKYGLEKKAPSE